MMHRVALALLSSLLVACASVPPPPPPAAQDVAALLRDDWYPRDAQIVAHLVPADAVFKLDDALSLKLDAARSQFPEPSKRLNWLLRDVFGDSFNDFDYLGARTTVAAETYTQKGGNCLSLTILAATMAQRLGFSTVMQEVRVSPVWQRAGNLDLLNRHVNVVLRRPANMQLHTLDLSANVIIDFDPMASRSKTFGARFLDREEVLAMFYNNLAAEALAKGNERLAYANLREALHWSAAFESTWVNLAVLYHRRKDGVESAERAVAQALRMQPDNVAALALQLVILREKGQVVAAQEIEQRLRSLRESDPHLLLAQAEHALQNNQPKEAIRILERALKKANGYAEMHVLYAQALTAVGDDVAAMRERATAASLRAPFEQVAMEFKKVPAQQPLP